MLLPLFPLEAAVHGCRAGWKLDLANPFLISAPGSPWPIGRKPLPILSVHLGSQDVLGLSHLSMLSAFLRVFVNSLTSDATHFPSPTLPFLWSCPLGFGVLSPTRTLNVFFSVT